MRLIVVFLFVVACCYTFTAAENSDGDQCVNRSMECCSSVGRRGKVTKAMLDRKDKQDMFKIRKKIRVLRRKTRIMSRNLVRTYRKFFRRRCASIGRRLRKKKLTPRRKRILIRARFRCRRRSRRFIWNLRRRLRRRWFGRRRGKGCCCRRSNDSDKKDEGKDEESSGDGKDDKPEEAEEEEEIVEEDELEAEGDSEDDVEEKDDEDSSPVDCGSNSEHCCQAIHEASDDRKNAIITDAKSLMKKFVDQITGADEDENAVALYGIFEDYVDVRNCIVEKSGEDVDIKKDLGIMLSMRSPKLTLEIFGNPHLYSDDVKLIVDNVDDSTFGKSAFFCQNDKCSRFPVGSDISNDLEGGVELFAAPSVRVKLGKNMYQPAAAYTIEKEKDVKFSVEETDKNVPKVVIDSEKESFSLIKDGERKDLKDLKSICLTKNVKATLKSSNGEWTLTGDICATQVDQVTEVKVESTEKDSDALYTFDISEEGDALPLQMEEFKDEKNEELLKKYKKFLGDDLKDELAIQYARFPNDEPICLSGANVPQKSNLVPTDPEQDVVKCKEPAAKSGSKKHKIHRVTRTV